MGTGNTVLQAFLSLCKKHRLKVHLKETGLKVVYGICLTFYLGWVRAFMTLLPKCTSF